MSSTRFRLAALAGLFLLATAPAQAQEPAMPADPQPAASEISPGLSVRYYYHMFRHIDELIEWQDYKDGSPGPVLERLASRAGDGNVLSSNTDDGVGAEITGLIHLEKPGTYAFALQSNDGVRLWIGDSEIVDDPGVHSDQFSEVGQVVVETPGWYPLKLLYFERKSTSTLELYWQEPGAAPGTMPLVPGEVLAHRGEG